MKFTNALIAAGLTVVAGAGVLAAASLRSIWESSRPATCMPDSCFCEAVRDQLIRQPANAASGLAFVAVAVVIVLSGFTPARKGGLTDRRPFTNPFPVLFVFAALVVGTGTVLYHASLTFWAQTLDVLGMYLLVTAIGVHSASRLFVLSRATAVTSYIAVNTVLLTGLVVWPGARRLVFAALVLGTVCLEVAARRGRPGRSRGRFVGAVLVLAAGFGIWLLDFHRIGCAPESWLQGHALWHLAGASATLLVFQYLAAADPAERLA
jgi:hypothetical protein